MNVLVTGSSGLIGQAVIRRLAVRGDVTLHEFRTPQRPRDIRDAGAVSDAMRGMDAVIHLAGVLHHHRPEPGDYDSINVVGTRHVLEAGLAARTGAIVLASSESVYARSPNRPGPIPETADLRAADAYGESKIAAERLAWPYLDAQGTAVAILRIANVYGEAAASPRNLVTTFFLDGRREGIIRVRGAGRRIRDYVWVEDVADAICAFLGRRGIYNVGGGHPTTTRDLATVVASLLRCRVESDEEAFEDPGLWLDIRKVQRAIRYVPTAVEVGIARTVERWAAKWPTR